MADATINEPVLPDVDMHLYRPNAPGTARVTRNEICTPPKAAFFSRHIEFDVSGTDLVNRIEPGQSIGVIAPGEDEHAKPHKVRLYSVASPRGGEDGKGTIYATTVKRVLDEHWDDHSLFLGVCSNYMCDCKEGDEWVVTGPAGKRFLLPEDRGAHDYVFFATGTGIAPFRGMVMDILARQNESRIVLVMGTPYATDLMYDEFFRELESEHERFTYLTAISREVQHDVARKLYVQDRMATHPELFKDILASERGLLYVCGIAGMELGILRQLASLLEGETLEQYMLVDPEVASDPDSWNKRMIHKQLKLTRRVMLEVYA